MPQVPTVSGPSVDLQAAPDAYQKLIGPQDDGTSRLLGQAANALGNYNAYVQREQAEADQVRVDDAINRIKERQIDLTFGKDKGFTSLTGLSALERQGGRPLSEEYGDELRKTIDEVTNGLGNDRQKRALQMRANDILTGFRSQVMQHEGEQFKNYQLSVREGTITNRQREIALYYNDPQKIDEAVTSINGAVAAQGRTLGKSAEWIEAQQRKQTSNAHVLAISAALEKNDVGYAEGYLKKYTPQMDADDILRVRGVMDKQVDAAVATTTATRVMQTAQVRAQPTDFDRIVNITMQTESGGKRFAGPDYGKRADGTSKGDGFLGPLKRPDGSVSTEISIGVNIGGKEIEIPTLVPGLTKAEIKSLLNGDRPSDAIVDKAVAHARKRIADGKSPFAEREMLTSPKGAKGEMQVMDGTNTDPGFGVTPAKDNSPEERARVGRDYLVAMVKRYDGDMGKAWAAYNAGPGRLDEALKKNPTDWLAAMPEETRNYVAKNMAALQQGGGTPERPTLQDVHNQVRAEIGEGKPARLKLALDEATRQYEDMTKAIKQREDSALANAQRWLVANGGQYTAMPASLKAAVPPGQMDNLLNFSERVARGEDRTNPAVYQRLSNPEFLRSLSDDQFYTISMSELSQSDRKTLSDRRGQLLHGSASDKPSDLNTGAIKSVLDTRLRELNIDPSPKDDGGADAARVGAVRQYIDRSILAAQAAAGKKFTDAEVAKHIDAQFAQTDLVKGWFSDTSKPMLTMKPGDIPSDVRTKLRADFKAVGIDEPTDAQMLGAYWQARTAANKRRPIKPLAQLPNTPQRQSGIVQ